MEEKDVYEVCIGFLVSASAQAIFGDVDMDATKLPAPALTTSS